MSSWFQYYSTLNEFISDFTSPDIKLWCRNGSIETIEVPSINQPFLPEQYVTIYTLIQGSRVRNFQKFTMKLAEFLSLKFSKVIPALNVYLSTDPTLIPDDWNNLNSTQQDYYIKTANELVKEGSLVPKWVLEPDPLYESHIQISESSNTLASNDTIIFGPTMSSTTDQKVISIDNTGTKNLRLTAPLVFVGDGSITITQPSLTILGAGEGTNFNVNFAPSISGVVSGTIYIPNNDPIEGGFVLNVSGLATNPPLGILFIDDDDSGSGINFGAPVSGTHIRNLKLKNIGTGALLVRTTDVSTLTGSFSINGFSSDVTLAVNDSYDFSINFSPIVAGVENQDLIFNSLQGVSVMKSLIGVSV